MIIIGAIIVISCVIGGFTLGQGKLLSLWQPTELLVILGAAFGSFLIANSLKVVKKVFEKSFYLIANKKHPKDYYINLLSLLFVIGMKIRKTGLISIEDDIERPYESNLFKEYPNILENRMLMDFIVDNLRLVLGGQLSHFEFESLLENEIEVLAEDLEKPAHALSSVSDALPGFGIVAAVLGIVITMQFIGGDPKILGIKVAAALVGTFFRSVIFIWLSWSNSS